MGKRLEIQLYCANTGESITFPINPESIDIPTEKQIDTFEILGYGEVAVKGKKRLKRITLSNILPGKDSWLALSASLTEKEFKQKPYSIDAALNFINKWIKNNELIRVIISNRLNDVFRIEKFTETVKESTVDEGYTLDFVQFVDPTGKTIVKEAPKTNVVKLKKRVQNRFIPNKQVAKKGMTIYKLAKLTYGGRSNELAKLNAIYSRNKDISGEIINMLPLNL